MNYVQIGDHPSHWPGKHHGSFPSWGNTNGGYESSPYHSLVVVINPCGTNTDLIISSTDDG